MNDKITHLSDLRHYLGDLTTLGYHIEIRPAAVVVELYKVDYQMFRDKILARVPQGVIVKRVNALRELHMAYRNWRAKG